MQCLQGTFHCKVVKVIATCPILLYLEKGWYVVERKVRLNVYVIHFYVVIVCHIVKQRVKAPGLLDVY